MARSPAIAELGSPSIDLLTEIVERGRAEGVFRAGVDAVDLHMMISAFCVFRVAAVRLDGVLSADEAATVALSVVMRLPSSNWSVGGTSGCY